MKQYGIFNADNGRTGLYQGMSDPRWNEPDLDFLDNIPLSAFEAVDESVLMVDPNSGQAVQPPAYVTPKVSGNAVRAGKFN